MGKQPKQALAVAAASLFGKIHICASHAGVHGRPGKWHEPGQHSGWLGTHSKDAAIYDARGWLCRSDKQQPDCGSHGLSQHHQQQPHGA